MTVQGQAAPVVSSTVCLAGLSFQAADFTNTFAGMNPAVDLTLDCIPALKFLPQFHASRCLIHALHNLYKCFFR